MDHLGKTAAELARSINEVPIVRVVDYDNLLETFSALSKMLADAVLDKRDKLIRNLGYDPRAVEGLRSIGDALHETGTTSHNAQGILRNTPGYGAILDAERGGVQLPHHGARPSAA